MDIRSLRTPCYIINQEDYASNIRSFRNAFESRWGHKVIFGYSVKTNNFPYMLRFALDEGFYAEAVSPDEVELARRCGCNEDRMIFNGPQKRDTFLSVLNAGGIVNLDNLEEVGLLCANASCLNDKARVGLRVNFDIEALCPGETTCVGIPGRFGISYENGDVKKAADMLKKAGIKLSGLHMHQSSRTRSLKIFETISEKAVEIGKELSPDALDFVDMGGGFFGGNYFPGKPDCEQYARTVCSVLRRFYDPDVTTLILEPGAGVLATSMDYLTSVLNIRDIRGSRIVTVDGSVVHINPFMNPHPTPFTMIDGGEEYTGEQIIGGSTCMELDRLYPRDIHNLVEHDTKLLFHCCGAYMSVHNSCFINAAPNIYLNRNGEYTLLREKSIDSLFSYDGRDRF